MGSNILLVALHKKPVAQAVESVELRITSIEDDEKFPTISLSSLLSIVTVQSFYIIDVF